MSNRLVITSDGMPRLRPRESDGRIIPSSGWSLAAGIAENVDIIYSSTCIESSPSLLFFIQDDNQSGRYCDSVRAHYSLDGEILLGR